MAPTARAHGVSLDGISVHGWRFSIRKGPIISDRDVDDFRHAIGDDVKALPEMLFSSSRVTVLHEASGMALDFTALGALQAWHEEKLPPLQVKVAQEWRAARLHEIESQKAVQLLYDWTFTTPYAGDVITAQRAQQPIGPGDTGQYRAHGPQPHLPAPQPQASADAQPSAGNGSAQEAPQPSTTAESTSGLAQTEALPGWESTQRQIDRALLMERDPILFFDEVPLFESDLDDHGVSQVTVKLRVMPRAWLLLLRFWMRVDGSMVRLRETRFFCRHDSPESARVVVREQRHCEGTLTALRAAGAPGEGPAYADADSAAQVFQSVAPIGCTLYQLSQLTLPDHKSAPHGS